MYYDPLSSLASPELGIGTLVTEIDTQVQREMQIDVSLHLYSILVNEMSFQLVLFRSIRVNSTALVIFLTVYLSYRVSNRTPVAPMYTYYNRAA